MSKPEVPLHKMLLMFSIRILFINKLNYS